MPSLENWDGGLKSYLCTCTHRHPLYNVYNTAVIAMTQHSHTIAKDAGPSLARECKPKYNITYQTAHSPIYALMPTILHDHKVGTVCTMNRLYIVTSHKLEYTKGIE